MANLVIKNNSQSDVSFTLDRGNNANWRMLNSAGILKVQSDWTDKKGSYYDVITLNYNSGSAKIKGSVTAPTFIGSLSGNVKGIADYAKQLIPGAKINGTIFTGEKDIITNRWGTERTLTIGNESEVVNGSDNVTWTLPGIGAAEHIVWTAPIKGKTWSRLCHVAAGNATTGSTYILNIAATRNNVVYNDTYIVKAHHSAKGTLTKIAGSQYTAGLQVRVLSNSTGDSYVELYDKANNIADTTVQNVYCRLIPVYAGAVSKYTKFTDGTTLPSGFAEAHNLTSNKYQLQGSIHWNNIKEHPTEIAGYGITNAYTKIEVDSKLKGVNDLASAKVSKAGDTMTGCLHIKGTTGSYNENIRLHPSSSDWVSIVLCGSDNTGNSGTSAKTWGLFTNGGNFIIAKNGSGTGATAYLHHNGSQWVTNSPFKSLGGFEGSLSGNATSATRLLTPRALKIGNSSKNFDGTGNLSWALDEIGAVNKAGDTIIGDLVVNKTVTIGAKVKLSYDATNEVLNFIFS